MLQLLDRSVDVILTSLQLLNGLGSVILRWRRLLDGSGDVILTWLQLLHGSDDVILRWLQLLDGSGDVILTWLQLFNGLGDVIWSAAVSLPAMPHNQTETGVDQKPALMWFDNLAILFLALLYLYCTVHPFSMFVLARRRQ